MEFVVTERAEKFSAAKEVWSTNNDTLIAIGSEVILVSLIIDPEKT